MGLSRSPRTMRNDHVLLLHDWIHRPSSRCGGGTEPMAGALLLLQRFHAVDVEMSEVCLTLGAGEPSSSSRILLLPLFRLGWRGGNMACGTQMVVPRL
ncbi:hypothetical protein OPV22_015184 [Ensete ventricosum]|uniref:Uncharacterized protein n=1 Tax=Ensete ventricosum TaxID=4639 RepID=A0AAV8PLI9_ENSVE|nr:hypothetical protein OPV22_015184 [Ensete ventricosum]